jgi:ubiquinone biosynthesis protein UbiJ
MNQRLLSPVLLSMAQAALDRALALDPEAGAILAPLTGKRIAVQVLGAMPAQLTVEFCAERILLVNTPAQVTGDADVSICGSARALLMLARGNEQLPSTAQVSVHGELALLQQARSAVVRLRPDFDEPLARLFGDELAYPLSRGLRRLASMARRTASEFGADVQEFLSEESGLLVARDEVQDFGDEVDRLRDALERLDKRVLRAARKLEPSAQ